jgi:ribose transport system substrate-binding protein
MEYAADAKAKLVGNRYPSRHSREYFCIAVNRANCDNKTEIVKRGRMHRKFLGRDPYIIKSVMHASELLRAFKSRSEVLSLGDLVSRSNLSRGIVFRLLYTLDQCGLVDKISANQYRVAVSQPRQRKWKIGYAALGNENPFVREITDGLRFAADQSDELELLVVDNHFSPTVAVRNSENLVRERVDLAIEYMRDDHIAAAVAAKFQAANIPVIAINNPLPGATYFGVNNYEAGLVAGRFLGRWALDHWNGDVDELVLMDLRRAGGVARSRLSGTLEGITKVLDQGAARFRLLYIDGDGDYEKSWRLSRARLQSTKAKKTLLSGVNDTTVLGAVRAYEEAGRSVECAAMGQNGTLEARDELRRSASPLVGSVGYFPEKYGPALAKLATHILNRHFAPTTVFVGHRLLTPNNVDLTYPLDNSKPGQHLA